MGHPWTGMYCFQLMDNYGASGIALMIIAISEVVAVSWIYGIDTFYENLEDMCYIARQKLGKSGKTNPYKKPWIIFKYIWAFVTPLAMLSVRFLRTVWVFDWPIFLNFWFKPNRSLDLQLFDYQSSNIFVRCNWRLWLSCSWYCDSVLFGALIYHNDSNLYSKGLQ